MSKSILSVIVFIITLFSFTSCTKDDNKTTDTADYSEILRNTGTNVILKTYESLATEAALLYQAIQEFKNQILIKPIWMLPKRRGWLQERLGNSQKALFLVP